MAVTSPELYKKLPIISAKELINSTGLRLSGLSQHSLSQRMDCHSREGVRFEPQRHIVHPEIYRSYLRSLPANLRIMPRVEKTAITQIPSNSSLASLSV
jgi:hypothetical protein